MNQKEVAELRRRLSPDKSAISRVYGCYVNSAKEILADLDEPLGIMLQEEAETYLGLLKKTLSGTLGKNLIDIIFTTQQVMEGEEHCLLSRLRDSGLKDAEARQAFYQKVIQSLDMEDSNYLILLVYDAYDVPSYGKDGEQQEDASDTVFTYILCAVCPVKDGKVELGYFSGDNEFHSSMAKQIVAMPELGFLFPAFDGRAANLYNALFYSRKADQLHQEFIDGVFHTEAPMSAPEQKEAFQNALSNALEDACGLGVVQAVHERLREKIEEHRETKDPEPLAVTAQEVGEILREQGVPEERVAAFWERCDEEFGGSAALSPANLIDSKRYEIRTGQATISVDPACSYLVESRVIDGRRYLLVPVSEGVEVNGVPVELV